MQSSRRGCAWRENSRIRIVVGRGTGGCVSPSGEHYYLADAEWRFCRISRSGRFRVRIFEVGAAAGLDAIMRFSARCEIVSDRLQMREHIGLRCRMR